MQVAKHLGITQGAYSQIESGHTYLSLEQAVRLSQFYNINVDWIATGRGRKEKPSTNGFIPLVDLKNRRAYMERGETGLHDSMKKFRLPGFTDGHYQVFETGDIKMRPTVVTHDYLVCTRVSDLDTIPDKSLCVTIANGEMYIGRLFSGKEEFIIRYDNKSFTENRLQKKDIWEVWMATAKITFAFFTLESSEEKRIQSLEKKMARLEQLIRKSNTD